MSEPLMDQLRRLEGEQNWMAIIQLRGDIESLIGPSKDRARAFYTLGRAYWNLARDPFDYVQSIRYLREAARLDALGGLVLKVLGIRLVEIGHFREGTRVLQTWISRYCDWEPSVQQCLPQVQYALGYAARYQADYQQAELWYSAALQGFKDLGDQHWVYLTSCALAQVQARMEKPQEARATIGVVPVRGAYEGYRLKAWVEILFAEGDREAALFVGEDASEALLALEDADPWELAELHILLATLQYQAGNLVERDRHLEVVETALRQSPRHDLYAQARLLLDLNGKEVAG